MNPMNKGLLALAWALGASPAWASNLDLSASYRMRGLSYTNLNLNTENGNNHSFVSNDARLGIAVRKIYMETLGSEDTTMDVSIGLHAVGVAGSSTALAVPLNRAAENYPNATFTPFVENAYMSVHQLFGYPLEATFGRQNFRLGSGLLLDDDGSGFTGATLRAALPWWGIKMEGFVFALKNTMASPDSLVVFGGSIMLPGEGTWQINQLIERQRGDQPVYGCSYPAMTADNCMISQFRRSFTSMRYQINYGPIVFDGEAALERGAATPTGRNPSPTHIIYVGDAEVVRAKWKQSIYRVGEGIGRISLARGSGDNPGSTTSDEAFFPSHGHRFEGLERAGFGEFFAATPYDAFGGNYSSSTLSGLKQGMSGIIVVGAGFTPPAFKGLVLDVDYFLYQATRVINGSRSLGREWDVRLRYPIQDHFVLSASAAFFGVGIASNVSRGAGRRYNLEVSGRF